MNQEVIPIKIPEGFSLEKISISKDWYQSRDELIDKAVAVSQVTNPEENKAASALNKEITRMLKQASSCRLEITRPLDQIKKAIMNAYRIAGEPLEGVQDELKKMMADFARAEEQKRLEERKRIEEQQQQQVEDQFTEFLKEGDPNAQFTPIITEQKVDHIKAEKTDDSRVVKRLQFEILNVNEIPRQFMKVNEAAIRKALQQFKAHYMQKCSESADGCFYASGLKISINITVTSK